jgi:SAM-dependent methyltransferase
MTSTISSGSPRTLPLAGCPVCGSSDDRPFLEMPDRLHGIPGTYVYRRCDECRTVFQDPAVISDDLPLCYPSNYYTHHTSLMNSEENIANEDGLRGQLRRAVLHSCDGAPAGNLPFFLPLIGRVLSISSTIRIRARFGLPDVLANCGSQPGRCLEVGPGRGDTLANLRRLGWDAIGLDIDPIAAEAAQRLSGCEVRVSSLISADFPHRHFDLVYMHHVLEHLPDLRPSLQRTYELLRPGGRLVLIYPNPDSLGGRWLGEYSPIWDPPRHFVLPSITAIGEILGKTSFKRIQAKTSARCAAIYCGVARGYRDGRRAPKGFDVELGAGDRAFAAIEKVLVALGIAVGEEIIITARK